MVRPGSPRVLRYPAGETVEPDGETYPSALADGLWTAAFASAVREAHLRHAVEGCAGRRSTPDREWSESARRLRRVGEDALRIEAHRSTVEHQRPAVDEDRAHVRAACRIHEVRDRIVPGQKMWRPPIHRDDVGALTRLEGADQMRDAERRRGLRRGHAEQVRGGERGGIVRRDLVEEPRRSHLREEVHPVVAAGPG